ncbi:F-box protein At1g80960-like [Abrus precatorius]|uniref:F-box protein At1g80960-like n=1 Tax=Abrus precatorius TaxID=3816 RepID=A0A8B8KIA5_ABRPR|nr:F-box protein At1g80960-like [Abrus precatorius]
MTKRGRKNTKIFNDYKEEPRDSLNRLPNEVLIIVLSILPIDDAVRSSVLSKRWRSLWKHVSHFDLDVEHMLQPLTMLSIPPHALSNFIVNLNAGRGLLKYSGVFLSIIGRHLGNLTSCRIQHFPDMELTRWLEFLSEKKRGLKDLIISCEPIFVILKQTFPLHVLPLFSSLRSLELRCYSLESPPTFEVCNDLKTLKLNDIHMREGALNAILKSCASLENLTILNSFGFRKIEIQNPNLKFLELNLLRLHRIEIFTMSLEVLTLISIACLAKNLAIVAPNLKVLHCHDNRQNPISNVLNTQELLEHHSGFWDFTKGSVFQNLSSLSVDLDLNNVRECLILSHILRSSADLQTLKIYIPVNPIEEERIIPRSFAGSSHYSHLSFWGGRASCNSVRHKLKFVYIEGFSGMELEVDFIKHFITRSTNMKIITIVYNISREDVFYELLSLPCASSNLTIKLKAAEEIL